MWTGSQAGPASRGNGAGIQVISRAAAVLRALAGAADGLSLSQLAQDAGLPRSTVHRLAAALEVEGLLVAGPSGGHYRIGPEVIRIADESRPALEARARPAMQRLFERLDETVDLAILDGDRLRFIDQIPALHRLRAVSAVGATFPLHCTANGKAALAQLSDDDVRALLPDKLPRHTPATITARGALLEVLDEIRSTGVAFDREEHTIGISAAGIALRERGGALAAVSVPMPTLRFAGREEELAAALTGASADLEALLAGA